MGGNALAGNVLGGAGGGGGYTEGARVYNNANILIADSTWTSHLLNSERYDTDTMHDMGSNTDRLTITTAGKYLFVASIFFDTHATGSRSLRVRLNGTSTIQQLDHPSFGGSAWSKLDVVGVWEFFATDYITMEVRQNSGGGLNSLYSDGVSPVFMAQRIG